MKHTTKKAKLLDLLKKLPYFSKDTLNQYAELVGINKATANTYISRFFKTKEILPLKKGFYVSSNFYDRNKSDVSYIFNLANIIRTPSYITSWTALEYYNLATEAIHTITSVTLKVTRNYNTKLANFSFQSVKKELFSDFILVKGMPDSSDRKFDFFIATPAKALFDLLYFKTRQFRGVNLKDIKTLVDELRIDINEMDEKEQEKFYKMINIYL